MKLDPRKNSTEFRKLCPHSPPPSSCSLFGQIFIETLPTFHSMSAVCSRNRVCLVFVRNCSISRVPQRENKWWNLMIFYDIDRHFWSSTNLIFNLRDGEKMISNSQTRSLSCLNPMWIASFQLFPSLETLSAHRQAEGKLSLPQNVAELLTQRSPKTFFTRLFHFASYRFFLFDCLKKLAFLHRFELSRLPPWVQIHSISRLSLSAINSYAGQSLTECLQQMLAARDLLRGTRKNRKKIARIKWWKKLIWTLCECVCNSLHKFASGCFWGQQSSRGKINENTG